ncbi:hypothetical protein PCANC_23909, partial [Puccinia coronata f. sp. avenae]
MSSSKKPRSPPAVHGDTLRNTSGVGNNKKIGFLNEFLADGAKSRVGAAVLFQNARSPPCLHDVPGWSVPWDGRRGSIYCDESLDEYWAASRNSCHLSKENSTSLGSEHLQRTRQTGTRHPDLASRTKNRGPADPTPDSPKRLRVVPTRHNPHGLASLSDPTNAPLGTHIFLQHHPTPPISSLLNTHTS